MDRRKKGIPKKKSKKIFLISRKNFQNRQKFLLDTFTGPDIGWIREDPYKILEWSTKTAETNNGKGGLVI